MLSERRKGDREKMANKLVGAMIAAGAIAAIDPEWTEMFPRQVMVRINAPGGAKISVDFDGESSQPDVHVCTWNTERLVFLNPDALGDVNPHHFGKVNRVGYGLEHLIRILERDLVKLIDGTGYLAHDDPRIVSMRARYEERGWVWDEKPEETHPTAIAA